MNHQPTPRFLQETGQFLLSRWGSYFALGFKGERPFIERSHAWAINTGLSSGELKWVYGHGGKIAYVTLKDRAKLLNAVTMQIRADMISEKEVPLLPDEVDPETGATSIAFNDAVIDPIAAARAQQFVDERIKEEVREQATLTAVSAPAPAMVEDDDDLPDWAK